MADGKMEQIAEPTKRFSVRDLFGIDTDMEVYGFGERGDRVPEID
ncbi:MAG TPA: cobaltochelatase subunit CobS, partial [Rhodobacteraceae bacterium]|nr:cobaltochelatase subunit CobS [Paracoccaceae bacterium]